MISCVLADPCHATLCATMPCRRARRTSSIPRGAVIFLTGLLVLVGVFSAARPVLAQAQEACPLPAGETPPADPRVTAQQVEDGSASLMDFTLAVRERSREHAQQATTAQQGQYIGCIIRQEGSPWRSGSTYIVTLTPDGRVFVHAKNMALSGRLLNPLIYAEILSALGVSPTDLANLASPDPGTAALALQAVFATLSQEPDAPFDATTPIPDIRPGIPGASGYAAVYNSPELGAPIVLLAGFDLNASHLVEEDIDHGDPAITAADVVGRRTLKAFVTQAGEFFLELMSTGDAAAASQARIALRDPEGPWRHGSVYLYVLDVQNNIVLFHATEPDLFELQPLVGTARDGRTGELILPRVLAAAKSNPEGNFVEYHYDDPADDSDSADIPKVGYAREFTGEINAGGRILPADFIVGSGFYPSAGAPGGALENPGPASSQSGTGALWGWVCHAELVEIEIEPERGEGVRYVAAYGLERPDTLETCGDVDNGFELVVNWNRWGDGEHRVTAWVDGVELGRATVWVTTLGAEVLEGVEGECVAGNFPHSGQTVVLEWQHSNQNFVITDVQ